MFLFQREIINKEDREEKLFAFLANWSKTYTQPLQHSCDRTFNGINSARKDRKFQSGRGSSASTSPVRPSHSFPSSLATFSSPYPSSTSLVSSCNPLNLSTPSPYRRLVSRRCFPYISVRENFPSYCPFVVSSPSHPPILSFSPFTSTQPSRLALSVLYSLTPRPFPPFLRASWSSSRFSVPSSRPYPRE